MAFISQHPVRFSDIDRAGIVYYPRFFDFFHRAFEDFFALEAGVPYHELLDRLKVGFPTVHIDCDFRIPLQYGDIITIEMSISRIGNKSMTVRYKAFRPQVNTPAAQADITVACVDMDTFQTIPLPTQLLPAFKKHSI